MYLAFILLTILLMPFLCIFFLEKLHKKVFSKISFVLITSSLSFLALRFFNLIGFIENFYELNLDLEPIILECLIVVIIVNAIMTAISYWYLHNCNIKQEFIKINVRQVALICLIMICSLGIFATINYVSNSFGDATAGQMLFAILSPLEGTSTEQILLILLNPVLNVVLLMIIFIIILIQHHEVFYHQKEILNPLTWMKIWRTICLILLIVSIFLFCHSFHIGRFIASSLHKSNFIKDHYVSPNDVNITLNENKHNLIHIYMESGENSFANKDHGGGFNDDAIPGLYSLAQEGISFSNQDSRQLLGGAYCIDGTNWTIAGITSTETGVPLKITNLNRNYYGKKNVLIPGAIGLGDILQAAGYQNYLMIGSDKTFAGRAAFYQNHGNYQIDDLETAKQAGLIPNDYNVNWGYEDSKLFEFAKQKLTTITNNEQPFNFTMLTTSTHAPNGYYDHQKPAIFEDDYLTATYYSDEEIVNFVRWCQAQEWYQDTTIVITGDHVSMNNETMGKLPPTYKRTLYNTFLNSSVSATDKQMLNRQYTTFDYFPTILTSLGFSIENEHLGLGVNLFSNKQTLTEQLGLQDFSKQLSYYSTFYNDVLLNPNNKVVYNKERLKINGKTS